MLKMAVLLSGSGRTLDNFHHRITAGELDAEIAVVLSDREDALGLRKAEAYGYPAYFGKTGEAVNAIIGDFPVDIVALAGFLQLYRPPSRLLRSVVNIHPSLIPSFCGAGFYGHHVHEAVRAKGCLVSGCTVHFANEKFDDGPIIYQQAVSLDYDDDANSIAEKVFAAECEAYPEALRRVAEKGVDFFWQRAGM